MKMKSVSAFVLMVSDLAKSSQFYESLGFEFRKSTPGVSATAYLNWYWLELLQAAEGLKEYKLDATSEPKGNGIYVYINVEDINEFYSGLQAKGLKPAFEPQKTDRGHHEFLLKDPDGYNLIFFQKP